VQADKPLRERDDIGGLRGGRQVVPLRQPRPAFDVGDVSHGAIVAFSQIVAP
jgi:hypothetical protein